MKTLSWILILLSLSLSKGAANKVASFPRLRNLHSSIVAGNWIYIDGGEVGINQNGSFTPENNTLAIDLSTDWTNSSLSLIATARPPTSLPLNRQSLWWDEKRNAIYCYGGEKSYGNPVGNSQSTPPESIWKFTPNGNGTGEWTEAIGPTGDQSFPTSIIRLAGGASSNDEANAYYLGGYSSAATSPEVNYLNNAGLFDVPGLLTFDFGSLKLRNTTAGGGIASDYKPGNWLDLSNMINVPKFGADGVLILLGGLDGRFQNITIYDKKTQTWLSQPASGAIPPPKTLICAVGVHDSNFQSYEIFIHGGIQGGVGGPQNKDSDEVYVLSLPAFRWFRANYTSVSPRAGHTCHPAGNNQLILIGGSNPTQFVTNTMEAWNGTADPWPQGIGVFDMNALAWKDSYQCHAAKYTPADVIKQHYNLSSPFPSQWSSTGVQAIFDPAANLTTASTPTASSVVTSSVPLPSRSHHLKPDAIAGVAVGCFSLLLLSSLGAYFIMNQKRRKASSALARDPQYKIYPELSGSDGAVEIFTPLSPLDLLREFKLVELGASKNPEQDVATRRFYAELPAAGATKAT